MADFTPILTLIITIVPIILLISILGVFLKGKFWSIAPAKKLRKNALKLATVSSVTFVLCFMLISPALGAGTMTPSSGTLMTDIPNYFSLTGVTASTVCHVNVTVGGVETNAIASLTSNSDGELTFSLTFTAEGSTIVELGEGAVGSGTNIVTGNFNVINFVNMIMPYIVLAITLSLIFGVVGMLSGMVRFRK